MHSLSEAGIRLLATKASPQEFTNQDKIEISTPSYFDSKLEELKNENREYHASTNSDKSICMRTVRKTGNNDQLEKEISLISYYSRGEDLDLNGVIRDDGEINKDAVEIEDNIDRSFVCRHISEAWLTGDLKLSQINSIEDLRKSPMVIKNGDAPEGIKKSLDDLHDGIKICNLSLNDIFYIGLSAEKKIDNYFKQYLSKSEYAELLSLREAFFAREHEEYLEGKLDIKSIHEKEKKEGGTLCRIKDILVNSKTLSIMILMYIIHTSSPPIGKLASNSNNDDVYSFSKNSFQSLLRELCETIYNRPENSSESFRWITSNHVMGLKITKKNKFLKIRFYNPANTISYNFVLKSPKDADMITIPVLVSTSDQELYGIIDDNDDMHVNTLTHVQND